MERLVRFLRSYSAGKRLALLSAAVLLVCLCLPWLSLPQVNAILRDSGYGEIESFFHSWETLRDNFSGLMHSQIVRQLNAAYRASRLSNIRFLFLVPLAYALYGTLTHKARKKMALVCAGTVAVVSLFLNLLSLPFLGWASWVFLAFSFLFLVAVGMEGNHFAHLQRGQRS